MRATRDIDKLILGVLTDEPANGYVIVQRIRRRAEGVLRPGEGFVYPVLYRMVAAGAIAASRKEEDGRPPRRVYSLRPAAEVQTGGAGDGQTP